MMIINKNDCYSYVTVKFARSKPFNFGCTVRLCTVYTCLMHTNTCSVVVHVCYDRTEAYDRGKYWIKPINYNCKQEIASLDIQILR